MQVNVGEILEGKVTGITGFGVFVEIGENTTGMVHISEVSRNFVEDINEVLKMGDTVKVKVMNVNDDGKISLSIKRAEERKPQKASAPYSPDNSFVWQSAKNEGSFEDMLSKFKQTSEEKMSMLKRKQNDGGRGRRRGQK